MEREDVSSSSTRREILDATSGTARGKQANVAGCENRETFTIDMVQDMGGFLYGLHAIVTRAYITESLAPQDGDLMDSTIHELEGYSTYCWCLPVKLGSNRCHVAAAVQDALQGADCEDSVETCSRYDRQSL